MQTISNSPLATPQANTPPFAFASPQNPLPQNPCAAIFRAGTASHPSQNPNRRPRKHKPAKLRALPLLLALFLAALLAALGDRAFSSSGAPDTGSFFDRLSSLAFRLDKPLTAAIRGPFEVKTQLDHSFTIPLNTRIPVRLPVKTTLKVPLFETFEVPLGKPFRVQLEHPLLIKGSIEVNSTIPLDTVVETKIMGVTAKLPVKGSIPVHLAVPIAHEFKVDQNLALHVVDPLPVEIKKVIEAPINFVVEGTLPLKKEIQAKVKEPMPCTVTIKDPLPMDIKLEIAPSDLGKGARVGTQSQARKGPESPDAKAEAAAHR